MCSSSYVRHIFSVPKLSKATTCTVQCKEMPLQINFWQNLLTKQTCLTVLFINSEKLFDHHIVLTKIQSVINHKKQTQNKTILCACKNRDVQTVEESSEITQGQEVEGRTTGFSCDLDVKSGTVLQQSKSRQATVLSFWMWTWTSRYTLLRLQRANPVF